MNIKIEGHNYPLHYFFTSGKNNCRRCIQLNKKNIKEAIEKLKMELEEIFKEKGSLQDEELQKKSRELDQALNKLYGYLEDLERNKEENNN